MNPWFIFSRSRWIFLFPTTHDQNIFCRQIYFPNHRGFYSLCYFYCYLSECPYSRLFIRVLICWCPRRLPQPAIFLWTFRHCSSLFFLFSFQQLFCDSLFSISFTLWHVISRFPPFIFISPPTTLPSLSVYVLLLVVFTYFLSFPTYFVSFISRLFFGGLWYSYFCLC